MASCVDEKFEETIVPTPGEDVKFSATVEDGPETRTLYGADRADTIMVKWVNGDTISVFGTTGGQQKSLYTVLAQTATSNTPNENDGQIYADDLQKTETYGVQWGTEETANFTAIYPSLGSSFPKDGQIKSTINATQNYVFPADPKSSVLEGVDYGGTKVAIDLWEGTHFGKDALNPSMQNAIMYARTEGVANGSRVNFLFKPFATVLKFRFMGFNSSLSDPTVHVQSITVTAPSGYAIAGDFTLDVTGSGATATATATAAGNNTNSITLNTIRPGGGYLPLKKHQAVDFNVFTVPLDGLKMGGNVTKKTVDGKATYTCEYPWKITIKTAQHGTFTYNVIPNVDGITTLEDGTYTATEFALAKGQIHKVKVPQLTVNGTVEWDYSKWITQIPKPVYLSELSMPGTWYSAHADYQNTTDLALQYGAGIRAFNIDCRMTYEGSDWEADLSGNPGCYLSWSSLGWVKYPLRLAVAGTESSATAGLSYTKGDLVVDKLKEIASIIPENEYVVVVLSIAEKPMTRDPLLGDVYSYGNVDPAQIIPEFVKIIKGEAEDSDGNVVTTSALKLYTDKITSNTTVDDVLGHMIIKINTNNNGISSYTYPTSSLVSFASMAMADYNNTTDNITDLSSDYYTKMQKAQMYWGNTTTDLTYYYHQAQRTTSGVNSYDDTGAISGTDYSSTYQVAGVPTLQMRKDAIKNIVDKSTEIYDASTHNGWFQLGIGGYTKDSDSASNSQSDVATELNGYVQTLIKQKMESDPSPVGIVLMNHATDENGNGIQLVKDIVNMNGKFYLKRAGGDVITGDGDGTDTTNPQAVPSSNAAYALVGEDAF